MSITRKIANRMSREKDGPHSSWSRPVVKIAIAGVALGIALIILSTAIVQGFQHEVKDLVIGFSSHFQITLNDPDNDGLVIDDELLKKLSNVPGVKHVAPMHLRPGLLETSESLKGVTVKGIDFGISTTNFSSDTTMIWEALTSGELPHSKNDILISKPLASKLKLKGGDRIALYLVIKNEDVKPRQVKICGIYETGLLEYDERFVFVNSSLLQDVANRGVQAVIYLDEDESPSPPRGGTFGLDTYGEKAKGDWFPRKPEYVEEKDSQFIWVVGDSIVSDTAVCKNSGGNWTAESGDGSEEMFAEGYEILISHLNDLTYIEEEIFHILPYTLTIYNVIHQSPEIFSWLAMLDMNVVIIIGLMILISIINMVSALLIVILERRPQVGLLKALGMTDSTVIKLFLRYAARIIGGGFLAGNLLGLSICLVQIKTGVLTLDPAAYYVSEVPILLDFTRLASIEIVAFTTCIIAMILPAWYSTRIQPSTALRMK
jgi:lipoprotein-releasing system permease protein